MKAQIVEVFATPGNLESHRGLLVGGVLILPDPMCPGEVLVRVRSNIDTHVHISTLKEVDLGDTEIEAAARNVSYNLGWFKSVFKKGMEGSGEIDRHTM